MTQLDLTKEPGWYEEPIPKEFRDKPSLELCWRGLSISIGKGYMTRKQAYEMIAKWERDEPYPDNVAFLPLKIEPPDIVA